MKKYIFLALLTMGVSSCQLVDVLDQKPEFEADLDGAIALGFMRSNVMLTSLSMFTGKLIRYIVMLSALQGALSVMSV